MLVTPCMLYPYLIELYSLRERKREPIQCKSALFLCIFFHKVRNSLFFVLLRCNYV